jgi:hypothetical protein
LRKLEAVRENLVLKKVNLQFDKILLQHKNVQMFCALYLLQFMCICIYMYICMYFFDGLKDFIKLNITIMYASTKFYSSVNEYNLKYQIQKLNILTERKL